MVLGVVFFAMCGNVFAAGSEEVTMEDVIILHEMVTSGIPEVPYRDRCSTAKKWKGLKENFFITAADLQSDLFDEFVQIEDELNSMSQCSWRDRRCRLSQWFQVSRLNHQRDEIIYEMDEIENLREQVVAADVEWGHDWYHRTCVNLPFGGNFIITGYIQYSFWGPCEFEIVPVHADGWELAQPIPFLTECTNYNADFSSVIEFYEENNTWVSLIVDKSISRWDPDAGNYHEIGEMACVVGVMAYAPDQIPR